MKRILTLVLALALICAATIPALADDVQKSPVKYYTRTNANKESAPDNELVLAEIEARSGIKLDVIPLSNESYGETLNMMIASGDVFDGFNLVGAQGINYKDLVTKDAIIPLNDLIDQYGPHIKEQMAAAFEYVGTDKDGNIWTLPRCEAFTMGFVPTIRKDWLDKLGMEMPKTLPELEAFFDAVLANDVNGNGDPNDEIPFLGDGFLYGMSNFSTYFLGAACTGFDANRRYLSQIQNSKACSIHVRRGDHVISGRALSDDRYLEKVKYMLDREEGLSLFVFSDDIAYCRAHAHEMGLDLAGETVYVEGNSGSLAFRDMQLMSQCPYMIIGDSAFGKIAALFNDRLQHLCS